MVVNKAPLALSFLLIFALPDISFAATMTLHAAVKAAKKGQNPLDPVAACRIWINGLYDSCENTTQELVYEDNGICDQPTHDHLSDAVVSGHILPSSAALSWSLTWLAVNG